jgi:flagellar biosynthesis protein FlhG
MSTEKASEWLLSMNRGQTSKNQKRIKNQKAYTISIASGKGGVGKTSVTLKLAATLSKENYKVLVIDCDYNLSNTAVKLGLPVNDNFSEFLAGNKNFEESVVQYEGFDLFTGVNGDPDIWNKDIFFDKMIISLLSNIERKYDFIFLDSPAGLSKEALTLNAYCDYRFIVVNPDRSSITDSYSLMKILNMKYGVNENHLIVNKTSSDVQYKKITKVLSETVENFLKARLSILGSIKREDIAVDQFDKLLLQGEKNSLSESFYNMAQKFSEECIGSAYDSQDQYMILGNGVSEHEVRQTV